MASAPGINQTTHQVAISGFVDGPYPESADLDAGKSMIDLVTSLAIAFGVLGSFCSCTIAMCAVWRFQKTDLLKSATPAASPAQPAILTSKMDGTKKAEVTAV